MMSMQLLKNKLSLRNVYLKMFISEFVGTFVLMFLGICTSSQYAFGQPNLNSDAPTWGWGLSVTMAVIVSGGVSGGHINPAVSLAFFSIGQLKAAELFVYWIAQYIGAFMGSACAYGVYYEALQITDGISDKNFGLNGTLLNWITYPKQNLGTLTLFFDQTLGTMMLMLLVLAIGDEKNMNVPKGLRPLCVGFAVVCIMFSLSHNCGAAINPARDFGPRVFISILGYGSDIFLKHNYFFWIPLIATHIGAVLGAYFYVVVISWNLPSQDMELSQGHVERYFLWALHKNSNRPQMIIVPQRR